MELRRECSPKSERSTTGGFNTLEFRGCLEDTGIVDDLPVNNSQNGPDSLYLHLGHSEVVPVEDGQISQLTGLNRADLVFHAEEPAVAAREHAKCFLASEGLITVHT